MSKQRSVTRPAPQPVEVDEQIEHVEDFAELATESIVAPKEIVPTIKLDREVGTAAVPLAAVREGGYCSTHLDVQLSTAQAMILQRAFDGLDQVGARLATGRRVANRGDVIRYILDQIAEPMPA